VILAASFKLPDSAIASVLDQRKIFSPGNIFSCEFEKLDTFNIRKLSAPRPKEGKNTVPMTTAHWLGDLQSMASAPFEFPHQGINGPSNVLFWQGDMHQPSEAMPQMQQQQQQQQQQHQLQLQQLPPSPYGPLVDMNEIPVFPSSPSFSQHEIMDEYDNWRHHCALNAAMEAVRRHAIFCQQVPVSHMSQQQCHSPCQIAPDSAVPLLHTDSPIPVCLLPPSTLVGFQHHQHQYSYAFSNGNNHHLGHALVPEPNCSSHSHRHSQSHSSSHNHNNEPRVNAALQAKKSSSSTHKQHHHHHHHVHNTNHTSKLASTAVPSTTSPTPSSSSTATKQPVLQCHGTNLKRKARCRNVAMMEFVGPQPHYCAEHIHLDPHAVYHKCGYAIEGSRKVSSVLAKFCHKITSFISSLYIKFIYCHQKCKEVVHKNFKFCYKHLDCWLEVDQPDNDQAQQVLEFAETTCVFFIFSPNLFTSCFILCIYLFVFTCAMVCCTAWFNFSIFVLQCASWKPKCIKPNLLISTFISESLNLFPSSAQSLRVC
jgi:hypothetical protein